MKVASPCVVSLTWTLTDTLNEELDVLDTPVEFFVGGADLLFQIDEALQHKGTGEQIQIQLEPEHAFGDFDSQKIFLEKKELFNEGLEVGMLIEGSALPSGCSPEAAQAATLTVSEIYPDHLVLDANHPLAGIALRLTAQIHAVRPASAEEQKLKSCGTRFFQS